MTVMKSCPGLEATMLRYADGKKIDISREYDLALPKQWTLRENSSLVYVKCDGEETIGFKVLVNDEYLKQPTKEGFKNSEYHLAAFAYINGKRQPQFKLLKKAMPDYFKSEKYTISKNTGHVEGIDIISPEPGAPLVDVQLQLYRYYLKKPRGLKKTVKQEWAKLDKKNAGLRSRSCPEQYEIGPPRPHFRTRYLDPEDEPLAIFRWKCYTRYDEMHNGKLKLISRSRVQLPRSIARIDLTTEEPPKHPEVIDLSNETDDEDEDQSHCSQQSTTTSPDREGEDIGNQKDPSGSSLKETKIEKLTSKSVGKKKNKSTSKASLSGTGAGVKKSRAVTKNALPGTQKPRLGQGGAKAGSKAKTAFESAMSAAKKQIPLLISEDEDGDESDG